MCPLEKVLLLLLLLLLLLFISNGEEQLQCFHYIEGTLTSNPDSSSGITDIFLKKQECRGT